MNMFTPRGYTAVPQEAASQDEDEIIENNNVSQSFEQRKNLSASRNTEAMSTPRTSRESEADGGETKERRVKRNVRFESRSLDDKPEPMSNARRLCFVVSLMICTLTIFVFAFTVPCKGPSCNVANMITTVTSNLEKFHKNWSMAFPGYSTGIVFHLSSTKTREVVISYGGKRSIQKHRSKDSKHEKHQTGIRNNWNTKASGLISLKEDNGKLMWLYNASDVIKLIECRTDDNDFETCLIQSSRGRLQLINPKRNQIVWSTRILIGSILPSIVIGINDCDGDDGRDILLSYDRFNTTCMPPTNKTACTHPGIVQLISGRTGYPLGSRLHVPQSHLIKRVSVHSTRQAENLIFVLTVGNKGHLKVISIQDLYRMILEARGGESPYLFKNSTVSVSDIVSTDLEPVVKDLNKDFVEDIILVTLAGNKHSLTAVDGGKLKKMWRIAFGSRKMLSQPVIGHFNDDEIPDILVILEDPVLSFINQSLVQILDGQNGNILWSRKLRLAKNTTPLAANVGYKSDVFLLWIEKESKRKYQKIFLSKAPKESSSKYIEKQAHAEISKSQVEVHGKPETQPALREATIHHAFQKNVSENSIAQKVEHHRYPRSVQSELDSLVDEIFVKNVKNTPKTESREKTHLKAKKIENTHKMLEDILKNEGQPSEVVNKESRSHGGRAKATTSARLATQGPKLYDIHGMHKPSMKMRQRVRQMMINSGDNARKSTPSITLATQRPILYDIRALQSKPSTRIRQLHTVRQMKINSPVSRNNGRNPSSTTITVTTQRPMFYDIHALHSEPSRRMKNKQAVMVNNPDSGNNGRKPSPTIDLGAHISLATERPIINNNPHAITKNPGLRISNGERVAHHLNEKIGNKVTNERHRILTTTKPSIKLSNRKIVQEFIIDSPASGIHDGSESHTATLMAGSHANDRRQSGTANSPTEQSLNTQSKIHEKPSAAMTEGQRNRQVIINNADSDVNGGGESPTLLTTRPESRGNIQMIKSNPTTNDGTVKYVMIQNPVRQVSDDNAGNNQEHERHSPTGNLPTHGNIQMIESKLTTRVADVRIQNLVRGNINSNQDTFHTTKHISNVVSLPTPYAEDQLHSKIVSDNTKTATKILKTNNPVPRTSLPHTISNHHSGITVEGMADFKSKDTLNKIRSGKDIIVLPTKSSTTEQPTNHYLAKLTQKKHQRQIDSNTKTTQTAVQHQQQQNAITNTNKRYLKVNEPTHPYQNNSAFSDDGKKQLKVNITHRIRNEIIKTASLSSQDVHKHSDTILNPKPSTKPQQLNATEHDRNTVNKLTSSKESNTLLARAKANTKVKLHNRVLSNAENTKESIDNDKKMPHIIHPVKLNGTGHLDENKSGQVKKTNLKSNRTGTPMKQQPLKITKGHQPKAGDHQTTMRPHTSSEKKKHNFQCAEGFDLSLIAIFPSSPKNLFSVISQENSIRKTKGSSAPCDTLWPTFNSSPLVHDADSDGFLEIIYAVNYGEDVQNERTMKVRKFSIKVDSED